MKNVGFCTLVVMAFPWKHSRRGEGDVGFETKRLAGKERRRIERSWRAHNFLKRGVATHRGGEGRNLPTFSIIKLLPLENTNRLPAIRRCGSSLSSRVDIAAPSAPRNLVS